MHGSNVKNIADLIRAELTRPLPGEMSHIKMFPSTRKPQDESAPFQQGGVLILLYPDNGALTTVFMKRVEDNTPHSGQISFPGGRTEPEDSSPRDTALRETEEELGIKASGIEIIGRLTALQIYVSNMEVTPFVGFFYEKPQFNPCSKEVDYLIEARLTDLLDPRIIENKSLVSRDNKLSIPFYNVHGNHIWGATAMILSEFLDILSGNQDLVKQIK
jgi:8-oxo-dGTP pyrophosphatase MutT (NUDIX family)